MGLQSHEKPLRLPVLMDYIECLCLAPWHPKHGPKPHQGSGARVPAQDRMAGPTRELTPLSGGHQPSLRPTCNTPLLSHPPLLPSPRGPPQIQALPMPYSLQTVLLTLSDPGERPTEAPSILGKQT